MPVALIEFSAPDPYVGGVEVRGQTRDLPEQTTIVRTCGTRSQAAVALRGVDGWETCLFCKEEEELEHAWPFEDVRACIVGVYRVRRVREQFVRS